MKVFACVGHKSLKILINSHKSLICTDLILLDLRLHPQIFEKSGEISIDFNGAFADKGQLGWLQGKRDKVILNIKYLHWSMKKNWYYSTLTEHICREVVPCPVTWQSYHLATSSEATPSGYCRDPKERFLINIY